MTYVFVIMLAQQEKPMAYESAAREPLIGCVTGFVLLGALAGYLLTGPAGPIEPAGEPLPGTVALVGTTRLTRYIVGVEIAGVLLLAAMVGSIAIARRRALDAPATPEGE